MGISPPLPKPSWLKVRAPGGPAYTRLKGMLRPMGLHTVCEEARCPNMGECWGAGTATFMLLGAVCTRHCRFCAVTSGNPGGRLDTDEPAKVVEAVRAMGLRYAVLTSVDRDDLPDLGAGAFAETVRLLKREVPGVRVEVLTPDFQGQPGPIRQVASAGCDVFAHNLETVARLHRRVRDARASYSQSLEVLAEARQAVPGLVTKSGLMLGLGEQDGEVREAMLDLRAVGVSTLTLGQYLQPTPRHLPVEEFVEPAVFDRWRAEGRSMGFDRVVAGPLVRSSYHAADGDDADRDQ